jgi:hypothetical protein
LLGAAAWETISVAFAQAPDTTGPCKIVMEMDPSLPDHTIFRPDNLSSIKIKLPIVAVAHGGTFENLFVSYCSASVQNPKIV